MKSLCLITCLLNSIILLGQSYISDLANSSITIVGTSSLHDWESVAEQFTFQAEIGENQIENVKGETVVKSIKSGKSIMDNKTYKALKADKFPNISLSADLLSKEGNTYVGMGQLTIGGISNSIPISINREEIAPLQYQYGGEVVILMTDYGIDPPTAMLGTLTTGDEVKIQFIITMTNNKPSKQ